MATINTSPPPNLDNIKATIEPTVTVTPTILTPPLPLSETIQSLKPLLSDQAKIYFPSDEQFGPSTNRWSQFERPRSAAVVNVASEADIAATVKWATSTSTAFIALSGGHGFSRTLSSVPANSIVINLRALNNVSVSLETGTAKISAGALTSEVIEAAHAANAHVMTGVCNSVGAIPPMLGGGLGNLQAVYGLAVDNMLSARLVTATGDVLTVSNDENAELWWGLRGAGHNFGIVSELTVKAHAQINGGMHWGGMIAFPGMPDILEKVWEGLSKLDLGSGKPMSCTMVWARAPPAFQPTIMIVPWYGGSVEEAEKAYAPILSLGPVMVQTGAMPYNAINSPNDFACVKNGHQRPCFASISPSFPSISTIKTAFEEWVQLVTGDEDFAASVVLTELYGHKVVSELGGDAGIDTAYPWRDGRVNFMAGVEFSQDDRHDKAVEYGRRFRDVVGKGNVYVNFSTGDEQPGQMYGNTERVERLRALKRQWDPTGVFSYYNPIR